MSSGSDIEMQSALPKKAKNKTPKSPSEEMLKKNQEPKKISTKEMIKEALSDLKTRKGISLYAIKKHITEKHNVNVDKINYIIKKNIKTGVEDGTFVQTKGIGASGSFKLAPKKKPDPSEKPKKKVSKPKTDKAEKLKTEKPKTKKEGAKTEKTKVEKTSKGVKTKKVTEKKTDGEDKPKKTKKKMAKEVQTPAKKRAAMMKRKSIGSIIKPPKMKPKSRA